MLHSVLSTSPDSMTRRAVRRKPACFQANDVSDIDAGDQLARPVRLPAARIWKSCVAVWPATVRFCFFCRTISWQTADRKAGDAKAAHREIIAVGDKAGDGVVDRGELVGHRARLGPEKFASPIGRRIGIEWCWHGDVGGCNFAGAELDSPVGLAASHIIRLAD